MSDKKQALVREEAERRGILQKWTANTQERIGSKLTVEVINRPPIH